MSSSFLEELRDAQKATGDVAREQRRQRRVDEAEARAERKAMEEDERRAAELLLQFEKDDEGEGTNSSFDVESSTSSGDNSSQEREEFERAERAQQMFQRRVIQANEEVERIRARVEAERRQIFGNREDDEDLELGLPDLSGAEESDEEEIKPLTKKKVVKKKEKKKKIMKKILKAVSGNNKSESSSKSKRSHLPKLNYSTQIKLTDKNFTSWERQLLDTAHERKWPMHALDINSKDEWDGKDDDSADSQARNELWKWLVDSLPESLSYMMNVVKRGDAKAAYSVIYHKFFRQTDFSVQQLIAKFYQLAQKKTQPPDKFGSVIFQYLDRLRTSSAEQSESRAISVFVNGLTEEYQIFKNDHLKLVKDLKRKGKEDELSLISIIQDAVAFAKDNKIVYTFLPTSQAQQRPAESKNSLLSISGQPICKFWRMKKGCRAGEKCPLAKSHLPEKKGKGWDSKTETVNSVTPPKPTNQLNSVTPPTRPTRAKDKKCFMCGGDHILADCPDKVAFAEWRASKATKKEDLPKASFPILLVCFPAAFFHVSNEGPPRWLLDGGSSEHIARHKNRFIDGTLALLKTRIILMVGNGQNLIATHDGDVQFHNVVVKGVLFCQECPVDVLSEGKFLELGCVIQKNKDAMFVTKGDQPIFKAEPVQRLMFLSHAAAADQSLTPLVPCVRRK